MQNNFDNTNTLEQKTVHYAGFGIRLLAFAIDNIILFFPLFIVRLGLFIIGNFGFSILTTEILFQYTISDIVLYLLRILYFVLLTYFTHTTLGKRICKLKVVSSDITTDYSFFDILYRETIGRYLSGVILYIGYFLMFINPEKMTLHDILSDTKVIYNNNIGIEKER